jgi:hypothetical protein
VVKEIVMTELEKQAEEKQRMLSFEAGVEEMVKAAGFNPEELVKESGARDMKEFSGWVLDYTASMAQAEQEQVPAE